VELLVALIAFVALDVAAVVYGADSRPVKRIRRG
jgi:hypothetical protein